MAKDAGAAEADFKKGLEGVVAGESKICLVDGQEGRLMYAGYDVLDLVEGASFEEVIYLLWNKHLPNQKQLDQFNKKLISERALPTGLVYTMRTLPHTTPPMDALRSCVSLLSVYDPEDPEDSSEEANLRRCFRIMAKVPSLVATFERLRKGHEPVEPSNTLNMAGNFLYQLTGQQPTQLSSRAMEVGLILHADHELNASTFAARVTVATLSDIYSGITSAIGTLKGSLHGGANQEVIKMLHEIGLIERVEPYIMEKLENKEKIMGFGHRVYKTGDPRAGVLRSWSKRMGEEAGDTLWFKMSQKIDDVVQREKGLYPNVDFYSASVYHTLDIPHDQYTPIFACSRTAGWLAHIMEQQADNRLIRPVANYVGPPKQDFVPLDQRA